MYLNYSIPWHLKQNVHSTGILEIFQLMKQTTKKKSLRGFAAMDPEKQRRIASLGGKAISNDRKHMATIGSKGGTEISKDKDHMAEIGRMGGKRSRTNRKK